jgi:hypothetical protein
MALPWRYAIRCIDELGLILRADIIWSKPNHLPEPTRDRVQMSHEYLFHFTRQGRYFAAIDEVREPSSVDTHTATRHLRGKRNRTAEGAPDGGNVSSLNPLGKAPGSVWTADGGDAIRDLLEAVAAGALTTDEAERILRPDTDIAPRPNYVWTIVSEPLRVPDHLGVDHFASYPSDLVRRCVLGWSPSGWCTACGEARRPVVDKGGLTDDGIALAASRNPSSPDTYEAAGVWGAQTENYATMRRLSGPEIARLSEPRTITGYACACPTTAAPTTPAVVLDPFAGTGTTVLVADQLGRHGIGIDLSADYLRLAEWRIRHDSHTHRKVRDRSGLATPQPPKVDGQLGLFEGLA